MKKFKVGDKVKLKSGGVEMMVNGDSRAIHAARELIVCVWHASDGAAQQAEYWEDNLELVSPTS